MQHRRLAVAVLLLFLWPSLGFPVATTTKYILGTQGNLLTTELNSLANNAYTAAGTTYDNTQGQTGDGYTLCDIEGVFTFGANPTANTGITVWLLVSQDGTNFEDTPTATIGLGRAPDVFLPVTSGQTGTRVIRRIQAPWGKFKAVAQNTGTGQTLAATANTIKIRPVTPQGVELWEEELPGYSSMLRQEAA